MRANGLLEASPDAVADDGVADFLSDGIADAWRSIVATLQHFNEKKPPAALFTAPDGQEFRAFQKPTGLFPYWLACSGQRSRLSLGAETLAATVAASGDDATASLGGHACTEAVPALADEFGRLVGTLHLF